MIWEFEDSVSTGLCAQIADRAIDIASSGIGVRREGEASRGGLSRYTVLDGIEIHNSFPELSVWYSMTAIISSQLMNKRVIVSPYEKSSVNLKLCLEPSSGQGWHYDTNPLAAVLYLSSHGAPTVFGARPHENGSIIEDIRSIEFKQGKTLIFCGREALHRVPISDHKRVIAVANLYFEDDVSRPTWMDELEYKNVPAPSSLDKYRTS